MSKALSVPKYSSTVLKITIYYLVFSALWIFFSEQIILFLFRDILAFSKASTYKGWFFIAATEVAPENWTRL